MEICTQVYKEILYLKEYCERLNIKVELEPINRGFELRVGKYRFIQHDKTPLSAYGLLQDEKGTIKELQSAKRFICRHKGGLR